MASSLRRNHFIVRFIYQLKTDLMNMSISADINLLSIAVADWMVELMQETLEKQDRFTLVLSGGNTPKKLNELLTTQVYKNAIDWTKVHIFSAMNALFPLLMSVIMLRWLSTPYSIMCRLQERTSTSCKRKIFLRKKARTHMKQF